MEEKLNGVQGGSDLAGEVVSSALLVLVLHLEGESLHLCHLWQGREEMSKAATIDIAEIKTCVYMPVSLLLMQRLGYGSLAE